MSNVTCACSAPGACKLGRGEVVARGASEVGADVPRSATSLSAPGISLMLFTITPTSKFKKIIVPDRMKLTK